MFEMEYFTLPLFLAVLVGFEREVSLISPCKPGMIEEGGIIFKLEDFGCFIGPWQQIPMQVAPFWQRTQKETSVKAGG